MNIIYLKSADIIPTDTEEVKVNKIRSELLKYTKSLGFPHKTIFINGLSGDNQYILLKELIQVQNNNIDIYSSIVHTILYNQQSNDLTSKQKYDIMLNIYSKIEKIYDIMLNIYSNIEKINSINNIPNKINSINDIPNILKILKNIFYITDSNLNIDHKTNLLKKLLPLCFQLKQMDYYDVNISSIDIALSNIKPEDKFTFIKQIEETKKSYYNNLENIKGYIICILKSDIIETNQLELINEKIHLINKNINIRTVFKFRDKTTYKNEDDIRKCNKSVYLLEIIQTIDNSQIISLNNKKTLITTIFNKNMLIDEDKYNVLLLLPSLPNNSQEILDEPKEVAKQGKVDKPKKEAESTIKKDNNTTHKNSPENQMPTYTPNSNRQSTNNPLIDHSNSLLIIVICILFGISLFYINLNKKSEETPISTNNENILDKENQQELQEDNHDKNQQKLQEENEKYNLPVRDDQNLVEVN